MFRFGTVQIFIIVHFRKIKKKIKKGKKEKIPVAGPFPRGPREDALRARSALSRSQAETKSPPPTGKDR
jgi:hypothetical protein